MRTTAGKCERCGYWFQSLKDDMCERCCGVLADEMLDGKEAIPSYTLGIHIMYWGSYAAFRTSEENDEYVAPEPQEWSGDCR